ncbi:MAG: ribulose-phosphate 3-epimerase [Thermoplasmata archaeon]
MYVSPSIMSAHLESLGRDIAECEKAGVFSFHLDVMDGHFAPNISMGPDFYGMLKRITNVPVESHLMLERPDSYYDRFTDHDRDTVLIHYESPIDVLGLLKRMKGENVRYGIAINPETPFEKVADLISEADILLIMSVHPGFSGQKFIDVSDKIRNASEYIRREDLKTKIEVDGGINGETAKKIRESGADIAVSASYIFGGIIGERIRALSLI